jgi:uncharacterized membrane protein YbhN (UPF0104 family)
MTTGARKWLFVAIKFAIAALLIWGVRRTIAQAFDQLREHPLHLRPGWLTAAAGFYLAAMLPSTIFWQRVMRAMGQRPALFAAIRAYYIGNLGKYVPGKALVVVLRAGFVRSPEVRTTAAAVGVFVETLTMMASGSFIAAALIAINYRQHLLYAAGAIACMLAAGLPTLPPVFKRLIRLTRVGRADPDTADQIERIHYRTLLLGWVATGFGWVLMGLSLIAVLRGMGQDSPAWIEGLPLAIMSVCASVVLGFISFIPGGLVVRDLVMAELIRPRLGPETAVASAIVLRLVWLAAELVAAGVFYLIHLSLPKPAPDTVGSGPKLR